MSGSVRTGSSRIDGDPEGLEISLKLLFGHRGGLFFREGERPPGTGVISVARDDVRMEMRHSVPEQVVVRLDGPQHVFQGAAHDEEIAPITMRFLALIAIALVRQADASASGYWNTSSSGTSNARAIWNATSREGE